MDVGPVELLIVLAVVLLLFGSKKLPELAKGMGQAAKEFRSGLNDEHEPDTEKVETKVVETKVVETTSVEPTSVEPTSVETKAVEAPNTPA
jgi:sec-independent protein translocase protein TatA